MEDGRNGGQRNVHWVDHLEKMGLYSLEKLTGEVAVLVKAHDLRIEDVQRWECMGLVDTTDLH